MKTEPASDGSSLHFQSSIALGKRKAIEVEESANEVICISDNSEEDNCRSALGHRHLSGGSKKLRKKRKGPVAAISECVIELMDTSDEDEVQADLKWESVGRRTKEVDMAERKIKVTRKEAVSAVEDIQNVLKIWDIPCTPIAFMVNLTKDKRTLLRKGGKLHTLSSFIRYEVCTYYFLGRLYTTHISTGSRLLGRLQWPTKW